MAQRRRRQRAAAPPSRTAAAVRPTVGWRVHVAPHDVVRWGLVACLVAVPLAFNLAASDVFELTKQVTLRILIGATLVGAVVVGVSRADGPSSGSQVAALARRAPRWPPAWLAGGVALAWTLATVFSVAPAVSVWGASLRWQGLVTQLGYLVVFLCAACAIRSWAQARRVCAAIAVVATALSLYGLLQRLGLDPLPWRDLSRRFPIGTFGNQAYFASILAQSACLTVGLALAGRTGNARAAWGAAAALQLLVLVLTLNRGGWLGAAAGMLMVGVVLVAAGRLRRRAGGAAALTALVVVGFVAAVSGDVRARLLSIANPAAGSGTGALRLEYWGAAIGHWLRRPLTGYGPDTQAAVFEWSYLRALQVEATDRAHNALFDALMVAGAAGALALGAVVVGTAVVLFRTVAALRPHASVFAEARSRIGLLVGISAALTAHLVEQSFNLEVVTSSLVAWTFAGASFALADRAEADEEGDAAAGATRAAAGVPVWARAATVVAAVGAIGLFTWWHRRPVAADMALKRGLEPGAPAALRAGPLAEAAAAWPYEPEVWMALAEARAEAAQSFSGAALDAATREAVTAAERAVALFPASPRFHGRAGTIYSTLSAKRSDAALAARAREAHARATSLGPEHWRNWHFAGESEFRLGAYGAAQAAFSRALALYDGEAGTWAGLGNAAVRTGDLPTARRAFEQVVRLKPNDPDARRALTAVGG